MHFLRNTANAFVAGGTASHLFAVFFADSRTGWAAGESGVLLKTMDGGGL